MEQFDQFVRDLLEVLTKDIRKTFQILKENLSQDSEYFNMVFGISAQHNDLINGYFNETIKNEDYRLGINSIRAKMIEIIQRLKENDFQQKLSVKGYTNSITQLNRIDIIESYIKIINEAKEFGGEVCIVGVANTDFFSPNRNNLRGLLVEALKANPKMQVRFIFLDPDSNSAAQRFINEFPFGEVDTISTIISCIKNAAQNRSLTSGNLHIRLAQEVPCYLFFTKNVVIHHIYFSSKTGVQTPTYISEQRQELEIVKTHFERLWGERWVLFDIGNVLIGFDHHRISRSLFNKLSTEKQAELRHEDVFDFIFDPYDGNSLNRQFDKGLIGLEDLHEEFEKLFESTIGFHEFEEIWCSTFDEIDKNAFTYLRNVQKLGIKVGLCSNTNISHWNFLIKKYPFLNDESIVKFLSFQMHTIKTEPEFYKKVVLRTTRPFREHLLLDDLDGNLAMATTMGFSVMKVENKVRYERIEEFLKDNFWVD